MIDEIQQLVDQYGAWLKDKTVLRQRKDWIEITTPYLDRHNDYLQIYAKRDNGSYLLTDGGDTMEDLKISGCTLNSRRQELLQTAINGFGVKLNNEALEVHASPERFASSKHNLLQAMLAVNDLFLIAYPMGKNPFQDDVIGWLESNKIRYIPNVKFTGASGSDHLFDFAIHKSDKQPERILQAVSRPRRDTSINVAFAWHDTRHVRPQSSRAYALLNDLEHSISNEVIEALRRYQVNPVPWSYRDEVREELAA